MKKFLLIALIVLVFITGTAMVIGYTVLHRSLPNYEGTLNLTGIQTPVDVHFDEYGVPHLQAQSSRDAYTALGYLHAQERLFQMELLRRAGDGRLSELLGMDLLPADRMFCTMGLREYADASVALFRETGTAEEKLELQAYMEGINAFIAEDRLPVEFKLLGSDCRPYKERDAFCITNYMAFSFALGQRTDPLVDWVSTNLGQEYLSEMALLHYTAEPFIPVGRDSLQSDLTAISEGMAAISSLLPISAFEGSNSWAVAGTKTISGFPLFCNDTHMSHGMPSIWYESHISYPGFELYGNHIPGIPYALIGHSQRHTWGLTMLEQDDLDFYREELSEDQTKVMYKGEWVALKKSQHEIGIKDADSEILEVLNTPHGPLVQTVFKLPGEAISMWWDFTRHDNKLIKVFRNMHHARSMDEFQNAVSQMHGPGLNVHYADREGNIAWWAAASYLKRPDQSKSKFILNGGDGNYDPTGYYDFEENPRNVNPESGVIYSANDQTGPMPDSLFYPGYYKPHHRGERILRLLSERSDWDVEGMKALINDVQSDVDAELFLWMKGQVKLEMIASEDAEFLNSMDWNGNHSLGDVAPTVYYKWLFHILEMSMADELGEERFKAFLTTHWMKRAYPLLLKTSESPWWDNVQTDEKENLQSIFTYALASTLNELKTQFGENKKAWTWNKARHLEIAHPMGRVKPLNRLFNVGPGEIPGGHETISQTGFVLNGDGFYPVLVGPQMRIVHDLGNPDNSWSVLPSGQSGHPLSSHYQDQFELYLHGEFRPQHFQTEQGVNTTLLVLQPSN